MTMPRDCSANACLRFSRLSVPSTQRHSKQKLRQATFLCEQLIDFKMHAFCVSLPKMGNVLKNRGLTKFCQPHSRFSSIQGLLEVPLCLSFQLLPTLGSSSVQRRQSNGSILPSSSLSSYPIIDVPNVSKLRNSLFFSSISSQNAGKAPR